MKRWTGLTIVMFMFVAGLAWAGEGRTLMSLDGQWTIAEGAMDRAPAAFDHTVPVPGLVDMAQPAFQDVGIKSPRREAFWYRRAFKLEGAVPAVAVLKMRQVMFGSKVILNGQVVSERLASFTPTLCDVRGALKGEGAENVLLVRVGASRESLPPSVPTGRDVEKVKYIPGIFDSAELILSGTPHVVNVQAVPDIQNKTVRVQAQVCNAGGAPVEARVSFIVREAKSGKESGRATDETVTLAPGEEKTVDVRIPIENCQLWSPEKPFLYELKASTPADTFTTRFGMRSFRFDPASGRAILNGKPYFMRGSNVCIFRFAEDPERGDKIWREDWVRRLHQGFQDMHWNCLRYCIGFPPEKWYEIADELGILIQDEFPLWEGRSNFPRELKAEELAKEYAEWIRERWNHPCVVIWDAQNETVSDQVGLAIQKVRSLDLSNRPWDNGWSPAMDPNDCLESHPYHFGNPAFKLEKLAKANPKPNLQAGQKEQKNAIVVNEYGWLWLNRDGTPCTLTSQLYQNLLGTASTSAQRFHLYARYLAAESEFWRAHRQCAAVMHFCGLGYSRADGQTSDHFIDLEKLEYEPYFFDYVRDAFAPVGVMLDFFASQVPAGEQHEFPVVVSNDLDRPWKGTVRLRLLKDGQAAHEQTKSVTVEALGQQRVTFACPMPKSTGDYQVEAALLPEGEATAKPVRSLRVFWLQSPEQLAAARGIALGKKALASSVLTKDGVEYPAAQAVDGKDETRWSSAFADDQWLAVDLGGDEIIRRLTLDWEEAFAKEYAIEVSPDGKEWREVYRTKNGKGGEEEIMVKPDGFTRWVRLKGIKRATPYGFSIKEMKVFRR